MAGDKIGDAFVELSTKDKKLNKGLDDAEGKLESFAIKGSAKGKLIGAAIGAGIALGVRESLALFAVDERSIARMNAVLKATGHAAGLSSKELQGMAGDLQMLTGIGDEVIRNTQSILLTFKQIRGKEFEEATVLALDMAEVLGQDAKQGAIQLGKALNDPIKGVTALSRVGVSFTEQQKEQIKVATEAGNIMKAQAVILDELRNEFGGAAEAAGDTYGGSLEKVKAAQGDVSEGIGEVIAELIDLDDVNNKVAFSLGGIATKLKELANSPDLIAFSERLKASMFETIEFMAHQIESLGQIIGRGLANVLGKTDETVGQLIVERAKTWEEKQELIRETFRKRLAKRLRENTDRIIEEEKKGGDAVQQAENKKRKARDQSLSSFSDILKAAQKAANLGTPGAIGGGAQNANPPGTTAADKITTTRDESLDILTLMLAQLKIIAGKKSMVFG